MRGPGMKKTRPASNAERNCLLVVGMHRSGTSALTRVINLHGAFLGSELLPPAPENDSGFWENRAIFALHERWLAELGRSWYDSRPLPPDWKDSAWGFAARADLSKLVGDEFGDAPLSCVKDPRLCQFLELWLDVLAAKGVAAKVVLPVRHPAEVAESLYQRNAFPRSLSVALWVKSVAEALRATRGVPCCIVSYDGLLADWRATIGMIARDLSIRWPVPSDTVADQVDRFLDLGKKHHEARLEHRVAPEVDALYAHLLDVAAGGDAGELRARVDGDAVASMADAPLHREYAEMIEKLQATGEAAPAPPAPAGSPGVTPAASAHAMLLVPEVGGHDTVSIYYRKSDEDYSETRNERQAWAIGQTVMQCTVTLPAHRTERVRIDPSDHGGWFEIRDITVDGRPFDVHGLAVQFNGQVIPTNDLAHSFGLAALDEDPWLEVRIDLPSDARLAGRTVALGLTIAKRGLLASVDEMLIGGGQLRARVDEVEHALAARLEAVDARVGAGQGDAAQATASLGAALSGVAEGVARQVEQFASDLTDVNGRIATLSGAVESAAGDVRSVRADAAERQVASEQRFADVARRLDEVARATDSVAAVVADVAVAVAGHRQQSASELSELDARVVALGDGVGDTARQIDALRRESASAISKVATAVSRQALQSTHQLVGVDDRISNVHDTVQSLHREHAKRQDANEGRIAAIAGQIEGLGRATADVSGAVRQLRETLDARHEARWHRRVRRWLARSVSTLSLQAAHQLAQDDAGRWRSLGNDPYFLADPAQRRLGPGWHAVEMAARAAEGDTLSPSLYPDYGRGYSETDRIPLFLPAATRPREQVICFNAPVRSLRFDPMTSPGSFALDHLRIRPISRPLAAWKMLRAVIGRGGNTAVVVKTAFLKLVRGTHGFSAWLSQAYWSDAPGDAQDYTRWLRLYDAPAPMDAAPPDAGPGESPLVSIVMPVYNPPARWLQRCIESVQKQSYPNWQLCIADDASTQPAVRRVLERFAAQDPRVQVVYRTRNGHISEASNSALALATGPYVALLDHDDELHPRALAEVVAAIRRHPEWRMIYSDEDKIDEDGRRFEPYFKPDWNYDLLLSQNYFSHFGVFSADLVREVGGFRKGYEGSQDHDLALRCIERIDPRKELGHIPRVLYHWRSIPGSTAAGVGEKSYAVDAGVRAITDHLARISRKAEVTPTEWGQYRVRYALPARPPKVSLIIPTRDKVGLLRACVGSILERTSYPDFEILVMDNQSQEQATLDYFGELARDSRIRVIAYDAPFNYSAINNAGVRQARGTVIGLINNDLEVIAPGWLEEMVSQALRSEVGAVGALLYYPDDKIQHAGVVVGVHGVACHPYAGKPRGHFGQCARGRLVQSLSAVTAACLVVRREVFEQVSGLDESLKVAFNDVDFCLRVRDAGYTNVWTPFAELYHHESASRGLEDDPEKLARFHSEVRFMLSRWGEALQRDSAYNPNLTLDGEPFSLAFPPRLPPNGG